MPARKRSAAPLPPSADGNDEAEGIAVREDSRSSSPLETNGGWKRRRRERASFTIGHRDVLNLDPHTDGEGTEGDHPDGEEDESDDVFEAPSESSESIISIGDDEEYGDNSDDSADSDDNDDGDNEERAYGHQDNQDNQDNQDSQDSQDGDERYARLLQQQEIALARSYLQDGFLGRELVAAMAAASEDSSVDMSYEALLELEENLGEVKRRGLEEHSLRDLPRQLHAAGTGLVREGARQCAVCLVDYAPGDELVGLPCAHRFHTDCAVRWLRQRATCPVCREAVPDAPLCIDSS